MLKESEKSIRITESHIDEWGLMNKSEYSIFEVIKFFSGYIYIDDSDRDAKSYFDYIGSEFYKYYKAEKLPVRYSIKPIEYSPLVYMLGVSPPSLEDVLFIGGGFDGELMVKLSLDSKSSFMTSYHKVSKSSLIKFAHSLGVYPLFLYPDRKLEGGEDYFNSDDKINCVSKLELQKNKIIEVLKALNYDCLNVAYGGRSEVRKYCIKNYPSLLTVSTFKTAWQAAVNDGTIRHSLHDKCSGKKHMT